MLLIRLIALFFLLVFLSLGAGLGYLALFGLRAAPVPEVSDFTLDLEAVRSLAGPDRASSLPVALNALVLARGEQPLGSVVAGQSWREPLARVSPAFQIVFEDRSLVVDAGYVGEPDPQALATLRRGLAEASAVLFTSSLPDHVRGIADVADHDGLAARLVPTRSQLDGGSPGEELLRSYTSPETRVLEPADLVAFAPGVVLIPAPGHTPGSQMIYVRLRAGDEFLLVGDVVWDLENVRSLTGRPHLVGGIWLREDEAQVASQIRALHDLSAREEARDLVLLPSHDAEALGRALGGGRLGAWQLRRGAEGPD